MVRPTAQTIIGGLSVSSLITLFVTPAVYSLLNREKGAEGKTLPESIDTKTPDNFIVKKIVSVFTKKNDKETVNA